MSYWDKYRSDDPRRIPPLEAPLLDYVVVDTETTGLNPEDGAKLIEIGAAKSRTDESSTPTANSSTRK
mgnify:CR=1 FL=1